MGEERVFTLLIFQFSFTGILFLFYADDRETYQWTATLRAFKCLKLKIKKEKKIVKSFGTHFFRPFVHFFFFLFVVLSKLNQINGIYERQTDYYFLNLISFNFFMETNISLINLSISFFFSFCKRFVIYVFFFCIKSLIKNALIGKMQKFVLRFIKNLFMNSSTFDLKRLFSVRLHSIA